MKPSRKNRPLAYYRHHRNRAIRRKRSILEFRGWCVKDNQYSRLSKGKVHCSCKYCSEKTRNIGYPHSQRVKLAALSEPFQDSPQKSL